MKKTVLTVALFTTAIGVPEAVASEPFCYMELGSNQVINLTALCGSSPVVVASNRSISAPETIPTRMINKGEQVVTPTRWQQKVWYR